MGITWVAATAAAKTERKKNDGKKHRKYLNTYWYTSRSFVQNDIAAQKPQYIPKKYKTVGESNKNELSQLT